MQDGANHRGRADAAPICPPLYRHVIHGCADVGQGLYIGGKKFTCASRAARFISFIVTPPLEFMSEMSLACITCEKGDRHKNHWPSLYFQTSPITMLEASVATSHVGGKSRALACVLVSWQCPEKAGARNSSHPVLPKRAGPAAHAPVSERATGALTHPWSLKHPGLCSIGYLIDACICGGRLGGPLQGWLLRRSAPYPLYVA